MFWSMKKTYVGFRIPKKWQILNRFAGAFHQASNLLFLKSEYIQIHPFDIALFFILKHPVMFVLIKYFKVMAKLAVVVVSLHPA